MHGDADGTGGDADVVVVGGGVAGLTAGMFTARAGMETVVVDPAESILARNAHLENFPGFPGGIDARRFLGMVRDQADRAGCRFLTARATELEPSGDGFALSVSDPEAPEDTETLTADRVVAASWSDASYLEGVDGVELESRGSKTFVMVDREGRTGVDGLYAAGRIADQYHQAIVVAGHGATVGISVVHDSPIDFYHDWVTPERYFTGRDRDVPPGCEEIDDATREERERASRQLLRDYLAEPPEERPTMHPSVADEE
jgi:thioredoxin reductase (NADPH)